MQIYLSDGTTTIYFAGSSATRFRYRGWSPQIAQYKGGGVFHDSPVSDGRRLVGAPYANAVESIQFNVVSVQGDTGQDDAADDLRTLMGLIEDANDYWMDETGQLSPVYLGVQGLGAASTQYALCHYVSVPELGDPAAIEWNQVHMLDLTLVVERGHWLQSVPGNSTAVNITSGKDYNSQTLGFQTESSAGDVVVAAAHTVANVTHCYYFNGTATYTDLLAGGTATFLGGTADYLLWGVAAGASNASYPINVTVNSAGLLVAEDHTKPIFERLVGTTWETVGDWTAVGEDSVATGEPWLTSGLLSLGLESRGGTPASGTVNGVDAFWVRLRCNDTITGSESQLVISAPGSHGFTSAILPYFTIDNAEIAGDLPALFYLGAQGNYNNAILFGARQTGRGSGFQSHINLTTITKDQNEAGVSVALGAITGATSILAGDSSVTGYGIATSGTVATSSTFQSLCTVTLAASVARAYDGYYRAFVTGSHDSDPAATLFGRLRITVGGDVKTYITPLKSSVTNVGSWSASVSNDMWDFGIVQIATRNRFAATSGNITVSIDMTQENGVQTSVYNLILIPIDEWSMEVALPLDSVTSNLTDYDATTQLVQDGQYIASSLTDLRQTAVGVAYNGGSFFSHAITRASSSGALKPGVEYNVYAHPYQRAIDTNGSAVYSFHRPYNALGITFKKNQRYKGLRGGA